MQFPVGPELLSSFVAKGVRLMDISIGTMQDTKEALEYLRWDQMKPIIVEKKPEDTSTIQAGLNTSTLEKGDAVGQFVIKM